MVAARTSYADGVKRSNPVKLAALQAAIGPDPTLPKAELVRWVGVSRATVGYWLRHLRDELAAATERKTAVRDQVTATHFDLLDRGAATQAAQVQEDTDRLRASGL